MKYKIYLSFLFLSITSIKADSVELIKYIQATDIENVKRILNEVSLSPVDKQALLDLAQNIIIQRNDDVFLSRRPNRKAKLWGISSAFLFTCSIFPLANAVDSKILLHKYIYLLAGLTGMGISIALFLKGDQAHDDYRKSIYKYYLDALEIKQLLFRK